MTSHDIDEAAPGLFRVAGPLGDRVVAMYLLVAGDDVLLVDCGDFDHPRTVLRPALARLGVDPRRIRQIVLTHSDADHIGGLGDVRAMAPHARVMAHAADADDVRDPRSLISRRYEYAADHGVAASPARVRDLLARYPGHPVDVMVGDRADVRLGASRDIELHHVPGHSAGHLALHDLATGSAVIGDALLASGVPSAAGVPVDPPAVPACRRLPAERRADPHVAARAVADRPLPGL